MATKSNKSNTLPPEFQALQDRLDGMGKNGGQTAKQRFTSWQKSQSNSSSDSSKLKISDAVSDNFLGRKELRKISNQGRNVDNVIERAVQSGAMLGSNLVNSYNRGDFKEPGKFKYPTERSSISPIIDQLRNSSRLDNGSGLFIGSRGSTATVLPKLRNQGITPPVTTTPAGNGDGGNTTTPTSDYNPDTTTPTDQASIAPTPMNPLQINSNITDFRSATTNAMRTGTSGRGTQNMTINKRRRTASNVGINTR